MHGFITSAEAVFKTNRLFIIEIDREGKDGQTLTWRLNSASTSFSFRTASIRALLTLYWLAIFAVEVPRFSCSYNRLCRSFESGGGGRKEGFVAYGYCQIVQLPGDSQYSRQAILLSDPWRQHDKVLRPLSKNSCNHFPIPRKPFPELLHVLHLGLRELGPLWKWV